MSGRPSSGAVVPRGATSAHGTRSRYVAGCDCFPCRLANADYQRDYMRRRRSRTVGAELERIR